MSQQNIRNRKQGKNKNKNQNKHTPQSSSDNKKHSKPYINKQEAYNAWPTTFIVLIILLIIVYNELQFNLPSITQSISNKKPYRNVEDFYPYYLSEHSHPQDQRLHIFGKLYIINDYTFLSVHDILRNCD